jgi:hypothetical protein
MAASRERAEVAPVDETMDVKVPPRMIMLSALIIEYTIPPAGRHPTDGLVVST